MGIWDLMVWVTDKNGVSETTALYSTAANTYTEINEPGVGSLGMMQLGLATNAAKYKYMS
jgi:hypothetical protein